MVALNFREALGQAVSSLEEEVMKDQLKRLESSAAHLVQALLEEYQYFFTRLQENVLDAGVSGDSSGLPPIFQNIGMQPWMKLSESWMARKNAAFNKGDSSALDFYRGVSNTSKRKKKSLYTYVGELGDSPGSVERFFGGMGLTFTLTQPDGRHVTVTSSAQLKSHLHLIQTSRDAKGRFTKFMQGTTLTANITAFPKLADVIGSHNLPDMGLGDYMGRRDPSNANQWVKFGGRSGEKGGSHFHRPAVVPLIQWYLDVKFKQLIKQYVF